MRPFKATPFAIAGLIGLGISQGALAAPKVPAAAPYAKPAVKKPITHPQAPAAKPAPAPAPTPVASTSADLTSIKSDVSDLKTQVSGLVDQQQKILDQLDQLKTLIQNQVAAAPAPPPTNYPASISLDGLPGEGGDKARVAIIEFTDFQCPYCGQYANVIYPAIVSKYVQTGKIKYFYRDDPLSIHEFATQAAKAAHCAEDQGKFWEMHDSLFANQNALAQQDIVDRAMKMGLDSSKFSQCIASDKFDSDMTKSANEANTWGVNGTPTFFIGTIDSAGKVMTVDNAIVGIKPFEAFQQVIEQELAPRA